MGEVSDQLTDPQGQMKDMALPFVQHHVSQLKISVYNVFLQGGKRKKKFSQIVLIESLVS